MCKSWLVLAFVMFPTFAQSPTYAICKLKGHVRTVRNDVDAQGVCHTIYSKDGSGKDVGQAKNKESCTKVFNNVRENLVKSNWVCRDIASVTFTESGK